MYYISEKSRWSDGTYYSRPPSSCLVLYSAWGPRTRRALELEHVTVTAPGAVRFARAGPEVLTAWRTEVSNPRGMTRRERAKSLDDSRQAQP